MIKGFFVLLVFASHLWQYISPFVAPDKITTKAFVFIAGALGQLIVVPFLFYSGYGVRVSFDKKGINYLNSFPRKRILKTYARVLSILVVFLLAQITLGVRYSIQKVLKALVLWDSFGNSNWYLFTILVMYVGTYALYQLFSDVKKANNVMLAFVLIYMFGMSYAKQSWWYNTALCYWLGLVYPDVKKLMEDIATKKWSYWGILITLSLFMIILHSVGIANAFLNGVLYNIKSIAFMLLILLFSMRFAIGNRVLSWCGDHVFEVYLLQRLPMIVFYGLGVAEISILLWLMLCVFGTILLSIGYQKLFLLVDGVLTRI